METVSRSRWGPSTCPANITHHLTVYVHLDNESNATRDPPVSLQCKHCTMWMSMSCPDQDGDREDKGRVSQLNQIDHIEHRYHVMFFVSVSRCDGNYKRVNLVSGDVCRFTSLVQRRRRLRWENQKKVPQMSESSVRTPTPEPVPGPGRYVEIRSSVDSPRIGRLFPNDVED